MAKVADKLDAIEARVMKGLKDFQRATVERIDWLYRHGQRRVLVSDEVGLGKTLVARGVVAKMAKLRRDEGDELVKVVYVCSNAAIARQNLEKLQITSEAQTDDVSSSRLSMQHLRVFRQENDPELHEKYIQLIPLTPDTSFNVTSGAGRVDERALMFVHLRRLPELKPYLRKFKIIIQGRAKAAWNDRLNKYKEEAEKCNEESKGCYFTYMEQKLRQELRHVENGNIMDSIIALCQSRRRTDDAMEGEKKVIAQLRQIFARISLEKLKPDLVIMDEFQRFKELLHSVPESDVGMLSHKFFNSPDVRMLLLSATPHKMYSTPEEIDETRLDEHYDEFFDVMRFLNPTTEQFDEFKTVWQDYSVRLREMSIGVATAIDVGLLQAKRKAEDAMYKSVCRTERISATEAADIIDDHHVHTPLAVQDADVRSFVQMQRLLDQIAMDSKHKLRIRLPVDFVKSSPYLLSFMRDYQLKRHLEKFFRRHSDKIKQVNKDTFWLKPEAIKAYGDIDCNNARLAEVMRIVFRLGLEKVENSNSAIPGAPHQEMPMGMEKLLWLPPSQPYYEPEGAYKDADLSTKTLFFSSWEMVPRMLSSLISYVAEQRTVGKLVQSRKYKKHQIHYFSPKRPSARMQFTINDGKPAAMALFCLLYPSRFLADCYDPLACLNERPEGEIERPMIAIPEIQKLVGTKIQKALRRFAFPEKRGNPDSAWYFLAPLMFDGHEYADSWLTNMESGNDDQKGFKAHIADLRKRFGTAKDKKFMNLGRQPDDLVGVLTDMAIASPAICALRTYRIYRHGDSDKKFLCTAPSQLAASFIKRMNTPEATAIVELACGPKSDEAHWRNLLTYCLHGNLQAVFDEYAHLLASGIDQEDPLLKKMHEKMTKGLSIRTTIYNADTFKHFCCRGKALGIRSHFAVAFAKGDGGEVDANRKNDIRNAFNSPFWPFVLATTSIGQEGLDFHNYCRRIVHWNLPANPIDLEQREGRINRFECLAIRQNVAKRYGGIKFDVRRHDVWADMFAEAVRKEKTDGASDLIPFWALKKSPDKESPDMIRIERIVPKYPFSIDEQVYERLITILSLYRLTLGQARQEELLQYLFRKIDHSDEFKKLFLNLSPFYKEKDVGEPFAPRSDLMDS